jgi:hypothetical protein
MVSEIANRIFIRQDEVLLKSSSPNRSCSPGRIRPGLPRSGNQAAGAHDKAPGDPSRSRAFLSPPRGADECVRRYTISA